MRAREGKAKQGKARQGNDSIGIGIHTYILTYIHTCLHTVHYLHFVNEL